jgi:hypothetical protein
MPSSRGPGVGIANHGDQDAEARASVALAGMISAGQDAGQVHPSARAPHAVLPATVDDLLGHDAAVASGAGPVQGLMRSAPMPYLSAPAPGQCPAARPRPTPLPIAARRAIGSPLAETVGSGGRTAHSWAADCISCGHPRTIPSASQRTCRAAPRALTRRYRPGSQRPCGPHLPTPVFASHARSATVARRSSRASGAATGARRRRSSADLSRSAGSPPTGTGTTPARVSAVSTSVACLFNRTSFELSSQKPRQTARPRTYLLKLLPGSLSPARRAGDRPNSDPRYGAPSRPGLLLIRRVRFDRPDEGHRAAATGLSLA